MEKLPVEIINYIVDFGLGYQDIYHLSCCSKPMYDLMINNNYLWYKFYLELKNGTKTNKHNGPVTEFCLVNPNCHSDNKLIKFAKYLYEKNHFTQVEKQQYEQIMNSNHCYMRNSRIERLVKNKIGFRYLNHNYEFSVTDEMRPIIANFPCTLKEHLCDIKYVYNKKKNYYSLVKNIHLKKLVKVKFSIHDSNMLNKYKRDVKYTLEKIKVLEDKKKINSKKKFYQKQLSLQK